MGERLDCRWQMVTCRGCGRRYQCTPSEDYFEATTLSDGWCWACFMALNEMPPQPEPPYRRG